MKPQIIVADDSQTIQKVIKITLANEDCELIECLSTENLTQLVQEHTPAVVLLDFNLSENKTGYDLAKEIKAINNAKIMMLYGTFDTIDEELLDAAGVNTHIVKPFDGNKFIAYCQQMIEEGSNEPATQDLEFPEPIGEEIIESEEEVQNIEVQAPGVEIDESWIVEQPEVEEEKESLEEDNVVADTENDITVTNAELNTLEAGMADWGIDVPGIISEESSSSIAELPPVIGGDGTEPAIINVSETVVEKVIEEVPVEQPVAEIEEEKIEAVEVQEEPIKEEVTLEATQSIDVEEILNSSEEEPVTVTVVDTEEATLLPDDQDLEYPNIEEIKIDVSKTMDKLETLTPIDEMEFSDDRMPEETGIGLEDTLGTKTKEEVDSIKEQIADDHDNLWKSESSFKDVEEASHDNEVEASSENTNIEISQEDLEIRINEMLTPMVEKMVKEKVDQIIEKISWEIIPDLAENLIRKELESISSDVLND